MSEINNPLEVAGKPVKKELTLFYVVDKSGSMSGSPINAVNTAIMESIPVLKEISDGPEADIKVATLTFSTSADWLHGPVGVDNFQWSNIMADGLTSMGMAFSKLNEKLSREEYLKSQNTIAAPIIILLSDGEPNDNWESELTKLKENKFFKVAVKFAIAVGNAANIDILTKFTGNKEAVLLTHNAEDLKKLIKIVSVTSSQIGSKSMSIADSGSGDINDDANNAIVSAVVNTANDEGIDVADYGGDDDF
jgi:uncharacterized protein YegL